MHDIKAALLAVREENALSRFDPRIKIFCALGLLGVNLSARGPELPLLLLLFCVILLRFARVSFGEIRLRMAAPVLVACLVLVSQVLWSGGDRVLFDFSLIGIHLRGTLEGVVRGERIASQVLAGVSLILVVAATTPSHRILQTVRWMHCPEVLIEIAILMVRYIFLLFEEGARIREAQRIRLGLSSSGKALQSAATLGGKLFIRAYDRAERGMDAMRCRCGGGVSVLESKGKSGRSPLLEFFVAVLVLAVFLFLR